MIINSIGPSIVQMNPYTRVGYKDSRKTIVAQNTPFNYLKGVF